MKAPTASPNPPQNISSSRALLLYALMLPFLIACSSSNNNNKNWGFGDDSEPFFELYEQGINRYLGIYTPMSSEQKANIITHTFGGGDGPLCLDGSEYRMATRDAGSEDLVIFLQGGGACWSTFCAANESAEEGIPEIGLLDPDRSNNPVKDWNLVYLPYCDGGLHASDRDNDYDNDGTFESPQRGLHNLSAALDVAVSTFPNPRRILLSGASGGGFGTTFALPLVRALYPDIAIDVVNDSGVGVAKPGQPEFLEMLLNDWNLGAFIAASCPDCLDDDGHLTNFLVWQFDQDPNVRRGILSYTQDTVLADFFLAIGGPAFEEALFPELAQMEEAHPDRVRSWVPAGNGHTFVQAEPDKTAGGVPVMDWIAAMLDKSDDWESVKD